ncbi:hypothetical protein BO78DRAFT_16690 [Aspergillus sclerotiicarbonarius CBS 121057]|uniref:Uncharacterized protein n=1 Tax=Aspergillus sclerotiicarbonarius (strain CBS 121057 / IBT 28362) TaxID=1448318 RepID=A0A319DVR0_ASPSB|nr:hypothetical protein BO78DRAFT_16690 [Aspergillus sclerotiicarbonarius CBS 121057]
MATEQANETPCTYDPLVALPERYFHTVWTNPENLTTFVFNILLTTKTVGQIVWVEDLTNDGREFIASNVLPDQQAFVFQGTTAVLRFVSWECQRATRHITAMLFRQPFIASSGQKLGSVASEACLRPSLETAKQPDRCYFPSVRLLNSPPFTWPSFVMETGIVGWLDLLRNDVRWWFQHSAGRTHTVMLLIVNPVLQVVYLEQWQLCNTQTPICVLQKTIGSMEVGGNDIQFDTAKLMDVAPICLPRFVVKWRDLMDSLEEAFFLRPASNSVSHRYPG